MPKHGFLTPKHSFLTPKAIANRIKSKGLQRLKWFCQMCQRQCRDDNGFKQHIMSESHHKQLLLSDNPERFASGFSKEFNDAFLTLLRTRHGTMRVTFNSVYEDYIADKSHVHLNSTYWDTLTGYVQWLGREGLCVVDETEEVWFIQYIDRKPQTIMEEQIMNLAENVEMEEEDSEQRAMKMLIERGQNLTIG